MIKKNNFKLFLTTLTLVIFFSIVVYEIYKSLNQDSVLKETKAFDRKILDAIEVNIQAGQKNIKIMQTQDGWKINEPIEDFVSESLMQDILNDIFNSPTDSQAGSKVSDWAKYGLSDPLGEVQIKGKDGYLLNIFVSQTKSYDGDTYLKLVKTKDAKNEELLLISKMNWLDLILKSPLDFVNKKNVFRMESELVKMIDVSGLGVFSKKDGLWSFEEVLQTKAESSPSKNEKELEIDPAKAEKIIQLLVKLNVFEFESKKTLKLVKPAKTLTVLMTNAEKVEVSIFNHFKDCGDLENKARCQLMSSSQAEHPFWVLEADLAPILNDKL